MKQDKTRLALEMPTSEHKELKAMAAFSGISLKDLIMGCVRENLLHKSDHKPNEETMRVIEDVEKGIGLTKCEDFEDFKKKLGF